MTFPSCKLAARLFLALALVITAAPDVPALGPSELSGRVREHLRNRIEDGGTPLYMRVGEDIIQAAWALPQFYGQRGYLPAWIDDHGPTTLASDLLTALVQSADEGLQPRHYHVATIEALLALAREPLAPPDPRRLAELDLLLTDAFLIYGAHLAGGSVDAAAIDVEWPTHPRERNLTLRLEGGLASGRVAEVLWDLRPREEGYRRLRGALAALRRLETAGGWPQVPPGPKLQPGDADPRVAFLRQRLRVTGELREVGSVTEVLFDEPLTEAVKAFQRRHGLEPDAVVGAETLAALNIPVAARTRQAILNLERWRWLPRDLGRRYLLVNIAAFQLTLVEDGRPVLEMKAVVGRDYRRTPVFSDRIAYLVLSPYWNVPPRIAVEDKLPLIRKDPGYLAKQHLRVFRGWGADSEEVDPQTVDWGSLSKANFPLRLRQDPGPWNALGELKFMFPNPYDVYLHGTPDRHLFARSRRSFSSGCIRIENPVDLAVHLLRDDPRWTRGAILEGIERRAEQTVPLKQPLPIHLLYWTAWVAEDGTMHFRNDIYQRDDRLVTALLDAPLVTAAPLGPHRPAPAMPPHGRAE
jgi:murein L,D-transpeptidase YcbB/YkuD